MDPVSDGCAEPVAGEALVDTVVLSSWLVVSQNERTSAYHLLDTESIDHQRLVILCPPIPGPHALMSTSIHKDTLQCLDRLRGRNLK